MAKKKRESRIIRILKKREEKEGDGFFVTPSLLTAILLIEKLCSRQDHCADSILKAEDYVHCESHVTTAQSLMKLEVFFQTAEQLW